MAAIWLAEAHEAAAVASLLVEFRDWLGRDSPSAESLRASVEQLMGDPATEYLLGAANDAAEPAAVCQLRFRYGIWLAGEDCWLEDLFVRRSARGSGLGKAIAAAALERARRRGCARVELDVDEANPAAVGLYERLGFSARSGASGGRNLLMRFHMGS